MQWRKRDEVSQQTSFQPGTVDQDAHVLRTSASPAAAAVSEAWHGNSARKSDAVELCQPNTSSKQPVAEQTYRRGAAHVNEGSLRHWASRDSSHKENGPVVCQDSSASSLAVPLTPSLQAGRVTRSSDLNASGWHLHHSRYALIAVHIANASPSPWLLLMLMAPSPRQNTLKL